MRTAAIIAILLLSLSLPARAEISSDTWFLMSQIQEDISSRIIDPLQGKGFKVDDFDINSPDNDAYFTSASTLIVIAIVNFTDRYGQDRHRGHVKFGYVKLVTGWHLNEVEFSP